MDLQCNQWGWDCVTRVWRSFKVFINEKLLSHSRWKTSVSRCWYLCGHRNVLTLQSSCWRHTKMVLFILYHNCCLKLRGAAGREQARYCREWPLHQQSIVDTRLVNDVWQCLEWPFWAQPAFTRLYWALLVLSWSYRDLTGSYWASLPGISSNY